MKSCLILIACLSILAIGCKEESKNNDSKHGSFTDSRDGQKYKTVKIGDQVWMAENLAYLPRVNPGEYGSDSIPMYYVYGYNGSDTNAAKRRTAYKIYGVLYNWPAAMNACPSGWQLPGDEEWTTLTDYLGGEDVAGGKLKKRGTSHWEHPNIGATNKSKFSALPGGYRLVDDYFYYYLGRSGVWWSSTEYSATESWGRDIHSIYSEVVRIHSNKGEGFSVRCIKDQD